MVSSCFRGSVENVAEIRLFLQMAESLVCLEEFFPVPVQMAVAREPRRPPIEQTVVRIPLAVRLPYLEGQFGPNTRI